MGNAADEVVAPAIDAASDQFGPTYDTFFSPPDNPTLLTPNPAPAEPPSAQSRVLPTATT